MCQAEATRRAKNKTWKTHKTQTNDDDDYDYDATAFVSKADTMFPMHYVYYEYINNCWGVHPLEKGHTAPQWKRPISLEYARHMPHANQAPQKRKKTI